MGENVCTARIRLKCRASSSGTTTSFETQVSERDVEQEQLIFIAVGSGAATDQGIMAMPLYRVHFSELPYDPLPALETLPVVEADDPLLAAEQLINAGRVPEDRSLQWCRVVIAAHPNGKPKILRRFPITPARENPHDYASPEDGTGH